MSVGNKNGVYIQVDGGEFVEGKIDFKEPMLYVYAPLSKGAEFVLVVDVREMVGASGIRNGDDKQIHEIRCKFR